MKWTKSQFFLMFVTGHNYRPIGQEICTRLEFMSGQKLYIWNDHRVTYSAWDGPQLLCERYHNSHSILNIFNAESHLKISLLAFLLMLILLTYIIISPWYNRIYTGIKIFKYCLEFLLESERPNVWTITMYYCMGLV